MHYLDHLLKCPIEPSLKVLQLRRLFDWTNMAAALPQFFGAPRHPCFEVSGHGTCDQALLHVTPTKVLITLHDFSDVLLQKLCRPIENKLTTFTIPKTKQKHNIL